jgi:hypothetical protein
VCNEGYSSSLAAATLRELGGHRATDLVDGFQALPAMLRRTNARPTNAGAARMHSQPTLSPMSTYKRPPARDWHVNNHGVIGAHEAVALVAEQPALVIACDGSATSAGTYQSDTVLDSAEDAQPASRRQVAGEFVREVPARGGPEGDVARSVERRCFDLVPFVARRRPAGVA